MLIQRLLSICILAALVACSEPVSVETSEKDQVLGVKTERFLSVPWRYPLNTSGVIRSADTVQISAEQAGTVVGVAVKEGNRVKQGQLLMRLDNDKQKLRLQRAKAISASTRADLEQAERQWRKFSRLRGSGAVSTDQLEQARSAYDALKARMQSVQAEVELAERDLADREIRSPIAGVVDGEPVETGERVQPGEPLINIQAKDALQVVTWVNQAEVNQLMLGSEVTVRSEASPKVYQARVESIAQSAHPRTGNFEVKCRLVNADVLLRDGMTANVRIQVESNQQVIFIPRSAVVDRDRKPVIFVLHEGRAQQRAPRFGLPSGDRIPVLSGLEQDEPLIIEPLDLITDGIDVRAEDAS